MTKFSTVLLSVLLGLTGCVGSVEDAADEPFLEDEDASVVVVDNDAGVVGSDAEVVVEADASAPTDDAEVVVVEEDAAVAEEDAGEPVVADASVDSFVCRGVSIASYESENCTQSLRTLPHGCPDGYIRVDVRGPLFGCLCASDSASGDLDTCLTTEL